RAGYSAFSISSHASENSNDDQAHADSNRGYSLGIIAAFHPLILHGNLVNKGIIINREVEVYRHHSQGVGKRTDIHIDAISTSGAAVSSKRLTAVIEVKGCWNTELNTAMETQLAAEYLRVPSPGRGLYVVCYFASRRWDPEDTRKYTESIQNLRDALAIQAKSVSKNGIAVCSYVLDFTMI
ncbi:MAG: hypothetical protein NTX50_32860, partial [Candidatus Sumerlaeota bacterium]|nr:hypothetical protein [Candidatus Sumerlaeota bacterium]